MDRAQWIAELKKYSDNGEPCIIDPPESRELIDLLNEQPAPEGGDGNA